MKHSAKQKLKSFKMAGVEARIIDDDNWKKFGNTIDEILNSRRLKIIQKPLPAHLVAMEVDNGFFDLDLSQLAGWRYPAVCKAAFRIIRGLNTEAKSVALVGGGGKFGGYMREMLAENAIKSVSIDLVTPIDSINEFDFVIAMAIAAGIIKLESVHTEHTIIDIGYSPIDKEFFESSDSVLHHDASLHRDDVSIMR